MNGNAKKRWITIGIVAVVVGVVIFLVWRYLGTAAFIRTSLSGLTLGSLFFMVAAGLTLIFGLMDVLNFAHGAMFMLGAYMGWQFYTNPTFIFGLAPLVFAFAAGLMLLPVIKPPLIRWQISKGWQNTLPKIAFVLMVVFFVLGVWGLDIMNLADTAMVAITTSTTADPLAEIAAQEPIAAVWVRPALMFLAGLVGAVGVAKPGDRNEFATHDSLTQDILVVVGLFIIAVLLTIFRNALPEWVLLMNGNLRFLFSIVVAVIFGFVFGAVIEITLIRPLYKRATFIVLMTLGLSFVIREVVQVLWTPLAYQMVRPPFFAQQGRAATVWEWFQNGNATLDIFGVTFPTYRLFIIALGIVMFLFVFLLMTRTRLGMIIRAGVQDPEMVEALGINVRRVFTIVFALGVAMAALGGIGAAPFIPTQPLMGDTYQMQGFITVVLGGMGSYIGAFIGAMTLGLARAFGVYIALKLSLSPAIAEASTVIIMIIVLLIRPSGLFGKKE
jgi:branched-chain amino acid transport system permease protein